MSPFADRLKLSPVPRQVGNASIQSASSWGSVITTGLGKAADGEEHHNAAMPRRSSDPTVALVGLRLFLEKRCGGLRQAFARMDFHRDGKISCVEFQEVVSGQERYCGLAESRQLFCMLARDTDYWLTFEEFSMRLGCREIPSSPHLDSARTVTETHEKRGHDVPDGGSGGSCVSCGSSDTNSSRAAGNALRALLFGQAGLTLATKDTNVNTGKEILPGSQAAVSMLSPVKPSSVTCPVACQTVTSPAMTSCRASTPPTRDPGTGTRIQTEAEEMNEDTATATSPTCSTPDGWQWNQKLSHSVMAQCQSTSPRAQDSQLSFGHAPPDTATFNGNAAYPVSPVNERFQWDVQTATNPSPASSRGASSRASSMPIRRAHRHKGDSNSHVKTHPSGNASESHESCVTLTNIQQISRFNLTDPHPDQMSTASKSLRPLFLDNGKFEAPMSTTNLQPLFPATCALDQLDQSLLAWRAEVSALRHVLPPALQPVTISHEKSVWPSRDVKRSRSVARSASAPLRTACQSSAAEGLPWVAQLPPMAQGRIAACRTAAEALTVLDELLDMLPAMTERSSSIPVSDGGSRRHRDCRRRWGSSMRNSRSCKYNFICNDEASRAAEVVIASAELLHNAQARVARLEAQIAHQQELHKQRVCEISHQCRKDKRRAIRRVLDRLAPVPPSSPPAQRHRDSSTKVSARSSPEQGTGCGSFIAA